MRCYWISLVTAILISGCSSYNYTISEDELEEYLDSHFKYEQRLEVQGLAKLTANFDHLNVELGREDNERIAVSGKATMSINSLFKDIDASLTGQFSAIPWLDTKEGAIYLKDLEVDSVTIEPGNFKPLVHPFAEQIINALNNYLENEPIFVLDKHDFRQSIALKLGQSIEVKPGKIDFVLAP